MNELEMYAQYFPVGKKVGVGIPLPNTEVFSDWAIIHEIDEDLVTLQLSRDILPDGIVIQYGQVLELRGGNDENGYCCRAMVVSENDESTFLLRLIGEVVSNELREFYRIDAFLPIKYYISSEQNIKKLHYNWLAKREEDYLKKIEQTDAKWGVNDGGGVNQVHPDPVSQWDTVIPLAANISGGGVRITVHQMFEIGEYVLLEILVPIPYRVIDVIGRVVFSNSNNRSGAEHAYNSLGVQFVYIDERDRDCIANYISSIQLKRIQQMRESYLFRNSSDSGLFISGSKRVTTKDKIMITTAIIVLVILVLMSVRYFIDYVQDHPKGEIQRSFEESVRRYREINNLK